MISGVYGKIIGGWSEGIAVEVNSMVIQMISSERDSMTLLNFIDQPNHFIHTCLEVSETELTLIGFASKEAQTLYKVLIKLNGIGRKRALAVLNAGESVDIIRAAFGNERKFLLGLPKIGPKNVDSIITQLKKQWSGPIPQKLPVDISDWIQAREVLTDNGMSIEEAELALLKEFSVQ